MIKNSNLMMLLSLIIVSSSSSLYAEHDDQEVIIDNKAFRDSDSCDQIKVGNLKAKKVKAQCIDTKNLSADCVDSTSLSTAELIVTSSAYFAQLCTQTVYAGQFIANTVDTQNVSTNNLSASGTTCLADVQANSCSFSSMNLTEACITNTLRVGNLLNCGLYRATAVFNMTTTYVLGDYINWDLIIDDPNNDIILTPTFTYVAPVSGYYLVSIQIDQLNLLLSDGTPVLGVPVSNPQIFVNGTVVRQSYVPYLTFFNAQKTTLTSILHLYENDQVQMIFDVLAINQSTGVVPIVGTVEILGDGTEADQSLFKITLLNVDCIDLPCGTPNPAQPCTPSTPLTWSGCTLPAGCTGCEPCVPCQCCS